MAETDVVADPPLPNASVMCPPSSRMTFEQFMAWADEDAKAELVAGHVITKAPASTTHQDLLGFLIGVIGCYVAAFRLGWVRTMIGMRLLPDTVREPDMVFVANEHMEQVRQTHLDGPAELVIEIVSADSVGRDRGDKYYEYEQAGIPEYWLIDSRTLRAEFYQLEGGYYQPVPPDAEGVYRSRVLAGFWLDVNWLQQDPLPDVEDVLLEVGGQDYAAQQIERLRRRGYLSD